MSVQTRVRPKYKLAEVIGRREKAPLKGAGILGRVRDHDQSTQSAGHLCFAPSKADFVCDIELSN